MGYKNAHGGGKTSQEKLYCTLMVAVLFAIIRFLVTKSSEP